MRPLPDIFYRDHTGTKKLRKKNKPSAGPCFPVLHKVAVLFIKITVPAQGLNDQAYRGRLEPARVTLKKQVLSVLQEPFHNNITPARKRFVLTGFIISTVFRTEGLFQGFFYSHYIVL